MYGGIEFWFTVIGRKTNSLILNRTIRAIGDYVIPLTDIPQYLDIEFASPYKIKLRLYMLLQLYEPIFSFGNALVLLDR